MAPCSAPQFAPWATSSTPIMGHALVWMFLDDVTMVISCVSSQTLPHPKSHLTRGRPPAVCDKDSPLYQLRFLSVRNEVPILSGTNLSLALCSGFEPPPPSPLNITGSFFWHLGGSCCTCRHLSANSFGSSRLGLLASLSDQTESILELHPLHLKHKLEGTPATPASLARCALQEQGRETQARTL